MLGSSSRLHLAGDVELSPPLLWVILKTMSGIYIVTILILALYDKLRERIIVKNRTAMISILFVLTGSIIVGCNFTVPMIWGPASWTSSSWGVLRRILPKAYEIATTFLDAIVIIPGFALILTLIGVLKGHTELGLRSLRVNLFKLEKIIILLSVTVAVGCYLFIKELEFINREYYFAFMVIVNVILLLSMISLLTSFYILIMIKKLRFRSKIKK